MEKVKIFSADPWTLVENLRDALVQLVSPALSNTPPKILCLSKYIKRLSFLIASFVAALEVLANKTQGGIMKSRDHKSGILGSHLIGYNRRVVQRKKTVSRIQDMVFFCH